MGVFFSDTMLFYWAKEDFTLRAPCGSIFFFRTYATDFAEKNSKGLLVAYFRQCKHVPLKDFLQLPCTITGRDIVACSDRRAMPII